MSAILENIRLDDASVTFIDPTDNTKALRIDCGSITTGNTRVLTVPDADWSGGSAASLAADDITAGDAAVTIATTTGGVTVRSGTTSTGTDIEGARRFIVTRQSTDATPAAYTFSIATGSIAHFKAVLAGYNETTTGECFQITVEGAATDINGTAAIIGTNTITTRGTTTATADVSVAEGVPDTIDLDMTGVAAETINWRGYIEFITNDDTLARTE